MGQRDKLNPVIYCIENTENHKKYIGSAARYKERIRGHKNLLRKNLHFSNHLQSAWNKYGEDKFTFSIIEQITINDKLKVNEFDSEGLKELAKVLTNREEYWIKFYKTTDRTLGYNSREKCDTNQGLKWSEESKKKFSEKKKGIIPTAAVEGCKKAWKDPEFKKKFIEHNKEVYYSKSEEEKQKIKDKRAKSRELYYKQNLEKYGYKTDPEIIKKCVKTAIENGHYYTVHAYFLDGSYFRQFNTISQALQFLELPTNNTNSIKALLDKTIFKGLIWSSTKYDKYPLDKLKNIKIQKKSAVVKNLETGEKFFIETLAELKRLINIPSVEKKEKYINGKYKVDKYEITLIAPILSDEYNETGEFIKNLYLTKDNNEPSIDLNGQ